jgi:hypothetical protein
MKLEGWATAAALGAVFLAGCKGDPPTQPLVTEGDHQVILKVRGMT